MGSECWLMCRPGCSGWWSSTTWPVAVSPAQAMFLRRLRRAGQPLLPPAATETYEPRGGPALSSASEPRIGSGRQNPEAIPSPKGPGGPVSSPSERSERWGRCPEGAEGAVPSRRVAARYQVRGALVLGPKAWVLSLYSVLGTQYRRERSDRWGESGEAGRGAVPWRRVAARYWVLGTWYLDPGSCLSTPYSVPSTRQGRGLPAMC